MLIDSQPDDGVFVGETSIEFSGDWMRKAKASGREYLPITRADRQIAPRKIFANLARSRARSVAT